MQTAYKNNLRTELRMRRAAIDIAGQRQAAADLLIQLKTVPQFFQSRATPFYIATDGEIDPAAALQWGLANDIKCFVPIVKFANLPPNKNQITNNQPTKNQYLQFAEVDTSSKFTPNKFGICEPRDAYNIIKSGELINGKLELVLVPLVGFDRRGNRLGMGGGFYDTTFAYKKDQPQCVDNIMVDNWDIPISAVVTDRRVYNFSDDI